MLRNQFEMALTPDQEREYIARLEATGVSSVRSDFAAGKIQPHLIHLTATWLSGKEKQAEARREASNAEQMDIARRALEAAERAASEAERQANAAERANTKATIALIIAIVSVVATAINTWMTHLDAHK
jgi:hypothetical protein